MDKNQAKQRALVMVEREGLIMTLGTNGPGGTPEIKAMMKFKNDGLNRFVFCSNTSARRTKILKKENHSCLYVYEWVPEAKPMICRGVMLSGKIELSWDDNLRRSLWQDSLMMYYPKGPLDPEFVVIQFISERGNYYEGFENIDFTI